ncbi:hypothetical protein [Streptomyces decoyicus]
MPDNTNGEVPTGICWCGCRKKAGIGRFFVQGHDKISEAAAITAIYGGSIPKFLAEHGFGPDNSVRQAAVDTGAWIECPHDGCDYTGAPVSVRNHLRKKAATRLNSSLKSASKAIEDLGEATAKPIPANER